MNWIMKFINSSIMKKQMMALTGLALCGFLVSHLLGNILIVVGAKEFNIYAHTLTSNPLIYLAEAILAALFLSHMGMAARLTVENKKARPQPYAYNKKDFRRSTFASRTMIYTGAVIFVFLIFHILQLKFGAHYTATYDGMEIRDLHKLVMEYFSDILHVVWYVIAMFCVAIHVTHGFQSAFQSLGFNHKKYNCALGCGSKVFAVLVGCGFSFLAIWCYLQGGQ